jgi:prepilin-type N-terminal cleavage/methylation domain-containing protein
LQAGFTLTEVLIGLLLLAFGILAIAGMQFISIRGTSFSHHMSQACMMAQEGLERLKGLEMSSGRLNTGDHEDIQRGILEGRYTAVRRSEYVVLRYTVSWDEGGRTHEVSYSTVKGR